MAKIKSFTDLQQSRKLAEILPIESADMYYTAGLNVNGKHYYKTPYIMECKEDLNEYTFPCWSLASLLGVLPDYTLQTSTDGTVFVVCESKKPMISDTYDNPIDTCVAMILKLYELNLL